MIGRLNESTLHAQLKERYSGYGVELESPVAGFVADVRCGNTLIEIQTGSFSSMKKKLPALLDAGFDLRLVYPIAVERHIAVYDACGEVLLRRRRSPRKGSIWDCTAECIYIWPWLSHPRLTLELLFIAEEERRVDDGKGSWRRRGIRIADRKLLEVKAKQVLRDHEELLSFIPGELSRPFTTRELAAGAGCTLRQSQRFVYLMKMLKLLVPEGKRGRSILYRESAGAEEEL